MDKLPPEARLACPACGGTVFSLPKRIPTCSMLTACDAANALLMPNSPNTGALRKSLKTRCAPTLDFLEIALAQSLWDRTGAGPQGGHWTGRMQATALREAPQLFAPILEAPPPRRGFALWEIAHDDNRVARDCRSRRHLVDVLMGLIP